MEYDRNQMNFFERQEEVWIVQQNQDGQSAHNFMGVAVSEQGARQLPGIDPHKPSISTKVILYRPSLAPVYGGPTLLEALWAEMDTLMERLLTGQEAGDVCGSEGCDSYEEETGVCGHVDNGDKYRAQELAWVLAIVTNAYDPSVDRIRAEAMDRWSKAQGES